MLRAGIRVQAVRARLRGRVAACPFPARGPVVEILGSPHALPSSGASPSGYSRAGPAGAGHRVIAALSSSRAIHIVLDHQHPRTRTPRLSAVSEGENDESQVNRKADVNPHIVLS